jgi:hypothetical protein
MRTSLIRKFCWLTLVGVFLAAGIALSTHQLGCADPTAKAPCPSAAHPHFDPHRRTPAQVKTTGPAGQHTDVNAEGGARRTPVDHQPRA